jgi:hypothetical protein
MTKRNGGPAFPRAPIGEDCNRPYGHQDGMTLREYAAIKLRVPNSGTDWLDDMIREARRMDYAGISYAGQETELVAWESAMLASREASK